MARQSYATDATESWVWSQFVKNWNGYAERHEPGIGAGDPDVWVLPMHRKIPDIRLRMGIAAKTKGLPIRPIGHYALRMAMIELKAPSKIDLRPAQWTWHERWQRMGGFVPVVTCDKWKGKARVRWMAYAPTFDNGQRELMPLLSEHTVWPEFQAKLYAILGLEM